MHHISSYILIPTVNFLPNIYDRHMIAWDQGIGILVRSFETSYFYIFSTCAAAMLYTT